MQTLKDRQNLHKFMERKVDFAVRGENTAQKILSDAEVENGDQKLGQRNSDIALYETHKELESQRLSLYAELDLRNRLFQEDYARDCQEIEELRRTCCKKTDRASQARIDELFMHQERNPTTMSQL